MADTAEIKKEEASHKIQVTVKKWNAVALWTWDTQQDNCAICRNLLMEPCIECQVKGDQKAAANGPNECTLAWGVCSHNFHFHCLAGWLEQHPLCPLCSTEWNFKKGALHPGATA